MELDAQGAADLALISETRRQVPLLLSDARALHLLACVRATQRLGGAVAEAGVLMGASARLICEAKGDRSLHLFDVFETHQAAEAQGDARVVRDHFGPVHSRQSDVEELLAGYANVRFHPGWFPQSAAGAANERFSFVHLDLDLAQGTRDALKFFWPRLVPGGIVLGDDYNLPEVRAAFEAHFASGETSPMVLPWHQVVAVKL